VESFEKIQCYGEERLQALALAEDRIKRIVELIPDARDEGYSMEAIARASHFSRQQLYTRIEEA
jgi:AraC-like DNA-binding protein